MAKLYFRYGAMNCGKTTALLQVAHNYEERGMRVLVLKPAVDTKGAESIVSRLDVSRPVDMSVGPEDSLPVLLADQLAQNSDLKCILIDEAQFLSPSQVDELFWIAVDNDIPVIAYGLRTDFTATGFPGSLRLLALSHELQELKTICRCGRKAIMNGRKVNGVFVQQGDQVAIEDGVAIEYEAFCAVDWKRYVLEAATNTTA